MKNYLFFCLISILILSCASQSKLIRKYHLENSKWKISYNLGKEIEREFQYEIAPNGQLKWKNPQSEDVSVNSCWMVEMDTIILSTNSGYARFKGLFITQDLIKGEVTNQNSEKWQWTAVRVKD